MKRVRNVLIAVLITAAALTAIFTSTYMFSNMGSSVQAGIAVIDTEATPDTQHARGVVDLPASETGSRD